MIKLELDYGHGGMDSGAVNGKRYEKNDVFILGEKVYNYLIKNGGFQLFRTRTGDYAVSINDRWKKSNSDKVDGFISFHRNSFKNPKALGTETLYNEGSSKGKKFAGIVQNQLIKDNLVTANRGIKARNNLGVLKWTTAPAILLEVGFISNEGDNLHFDRNLEAIAISIVKGICKNYGVSFNLKESKNNPEFKPDKINLNLMGNTLYLDGFLKNGTNYLKIDSKYVAIRNLLENMGLEVKYSASTGFILANEVNGKEFKESFKADLLGVNIDMNGITKEGTNYLKVEGSLIPVREVGKALNLKVGWDNKNRKVIFNM